jgi:ribosomal protein L32
MNYSIQSGYRCPTCGLWSFHNTVHHCAGFAAPTGSWQCPTCGEMIPPHTTHYCGAIKSNPAHAMLAACLQLVKVLCELDPPPDTPYGRLLVGLATALEAYEREERE